MVRTALRELGGSRLGAAGSVTQSRHPDARAMGALASIVAVSALLLVRLAPAGGRAYPVGTFLRGSRCTNSSLRFSRRRLDDLPCRRFQEASLLEPSSHGLQPK